MSINKLIPPATASAAATRRLAALESAYGRLPAVEAGGGIITNLVDCLPVYHLDCGKPGGFGMSLLAAKHVGWQYLIGQGANAASVEVVNDQAVAVDRGQVARHIASALEVAEGSSSDQEYEARMLTFGRVGNPVLWLHADNGGGERFFSLGPEPSEVEPASVLASASQHARVRQARRTDFFDTTDDETGG